MPTTAHLALGSNLGDRRAILDAALGALDTSPGVSVRAASPYLETPPVGGPSGQGPFLNAAAEISTSLSPQALLELLQEIERGAGRVRRVRWGERSLDLDLLLFADLVSDATGLQVPHPRMAFRRFVLAPLAAIAPGAVHPPTGRTISDLLANLDRRPSRVAFLPDRSRPQLADELARRLAPHLPAGDRWIISALPLPSSRKTASGPATGHDVYGGGGFAPPTFLVQIGPPDASPAGLGEPTGSPWQGVPILRPESNAPDAILGEVVATCLAGRP